MPNAKSNSLREQIVAAYESGEGSTHSLAKRFGVSQSSVSRYLRRKTLTGSPRPAREIIPGPKFRVDAIVLEVLAREFLEETYDQLAKRYQGVTGDLIDRSTVHRYLKAMGLSRKERKAMNRA